MFWLFVCKYEALLVVWYLQWEYTLKCCQLMSFACSPCLLPSSSFTISGKKIKSYCHGTDLKIKTVPCIFTVAYVFSLSECTCIFCHITSTSHDSPYAFLSGKPEMSIDSSTSMSGNNTLYLLTLQVNCATI